MMFASKPADFNKQIDVVGCFVLVDDKFVLLQRQPHKSHGGKWGLPAGKVDDGETLTQAVVRELSEETGVQISENDLKPAQKLHVRYDGFDFDWHMFSVAMPILPTIRINPAEHQHFIWVSADQSLTMNLIHDLDECIRIFFEI